MNFAFYGQAITTGRRPARPIRAQQLADAAARVSRHGGAIVADYFDVYPDRLRAWWHRREAARLLKAIEDPKRTFDALIIGDTRTALTAMQYQDLLALCTACGVQLFLPEVGEAVDPDNEEHQEIILETLWGFPPRLWDSIAQMSIEAASAVVRAGESEPHVHPTDWSPEPRTPRPCGGEAAEAAATVPAEKPSSQAS